MTSTTGARIEISGLTKRFGGFVAVDDLTFTVEPGLYFIPQLHAAWEAEGKFPQFIKYEASKSWLDIGGIRDEEDWLVTSDGARRLGPEFDTSAAAIEGARR